MSKEKEIKKFENITEQNIKKLGVQALADRPNVAGKYGESGKSSTELKAWFDNLAEFIANKINTVQDTLATDDIAQYIKIALDEYDIEHLQDLIDALGDGSFAENLLMVSSSLNETEKKSLQTVIYEINKKFADEISELKKTLTDLGYGYTDAKVIVVENGGDVGASVEVVDEDGEKTLVFTFRNYGVAVADAVLEIDEKVEKIENDIKDAIRIPLKLGTGENSVVQLTRAGQENSATGRGAVALGNSGEASGDGSITENIGCKSKGKASRSSGYYTTANADYSDVGGWGTKSHKNAPTQFVRGKFNKPNPDALFQIGNGTSADDRSNAFEVLKDGTVVGGRVASGEFTPIYEYSDSDLGIQYSRIDISAVLVFDAKPKFILFSGVGSNQRPDARTGIYAWGDDKVVAPIYGKSAGNTYFIEVDAAPVDNGDGTYQLTISSLVRADLAGYGSNWTMGFTHYIAVF